MENLVLFRHHIAYKAISVKSVDTAAIAHLIRKKSFCIKEMRSDDNDFKQRFIRKPEDAYWVKYGEESHANEIQWFIEDCDIQTVYNCDIELEGDCNITHITGQLFVGYQHPDQIKDGMINLLNHYGYFAAEQIWDYTMKFDKSIPIDSLQGIENENLKKEHLDNAFNIADEIEKENMKYKKPK